MWGDRQTDLEMAWVDPSYARREIPLIATHLTTCSTLLLDRICAANPREFLIEGCLECQSQIQMNRWSSTTNLLLLSLGRVLINWEGIRRTCYIFLGGTYVKHP